MKIGFFSSKFPYNKTVKDYLCGGSIFATNYVVNEISKKGCQVKLFTTSSTSKDAFEKINNLEIYRYGTKFRLLSSNLSSGLFYKPLKHDVDITHVSFDIPPGPFAGYRYAKRKKTPLIVTYHGDWEVEYGGFIRKFGIKFLNKFLVQKLLSRADIIISPSKIYIEKSRFLKKNKKKVQVIPNGIKNDEFEIPYTKEECKKILGIPNNHNILLFVGNLSPYKSPDLLLKAMPTILKYEPNTLLILAGDGEMKNELENMALKLGIQRKILFTGFIENIKRAMYFKSADIFCLPSTMSTESFGIVNLEAMASGVPVIASNIGGIPDVVEDGKTGILVPPNNSEYLSNEIINLIENKNLRIKLGKNGKIKSLDYSWEKIAQEYLEIYHSV